jgi:ABC-type branched-subunit amino acid transport system permease subunit
MTRPRSLGCLCCIAAYTAMGLALVAGGVGLQWLGIALCVAVGVFTLGAVVMGRL